MSRRFAFEPAARETYLALRKDPSSPLYLALKQTLSELNTDPGSRPVRQLRYRPDTWGVRVRAADARWLILWRPSEDDADVIEVHYIGPEPGET
ncbi:MAG: hypothetical protein ACRD1G_06970 [Acidimicrobiales bacterium]